MKKTTQIFLFFSFICSISVFADKKLEKAGAIGVKTQRVINQTVNTVNSFTPFYSEDFSAGFPAGWQSIDTASPAGLNWQYTTTGSFNGATLSPTGTSAANGYMIYDSDSAGGSLGGENVDLISDVINCTGHPTVVLNFNEYLTHFNDTATVWVSNDGINWVEVHNSSSGLAMYASTSNPNNVNIDISSVAANEDTLYIRFNYKADFSYYWMIDDVQLYELPSIDGSVAAIIDPQNSCALLSSTEPVIVNIGNTGGADINGNISITMILDSGTPVTETVTDTILAGSDIQYTFTATADISSPGTHYLTVYISVPGDTNHVNDTLSISFFNGPHVVNNSTPYATSFEQTDDFSGYFIEDINTDSVTWELGTLFPYSGSYAAQLTGSVADDWLFTTCLELDTSSVYTLTYYYRTSSSNTEALLEILIGDVQTAGGMNQVIQSSTLVSSPFYNQATAVFTPSTPGIYYIGFHATNTNALAGLFIDDINLTTDSGGVGLKKINETAYTIYPNPSNGFFNILNRENNSKGYRIEVVNSLGREVLTKNLKTLNTYQIDLRDEPAGIYFLRVITDEGITTQRILKGN